jgi:hypothetical protein
MEFLRIENDRAILSNGYKYTSANLEMLIANIKKFHPKRLSEIPELERALEAIRQHKSKKL